MASDLVRIVTTPRLPGLSITQAGARQIPYLIAVGPALIAVVASMPPPLGQTSDCCA